MGPWHVKMPHKTCWGCDCCWCWCLETCWGQFVADLEAEVLVIKLNFCSDFEHKVWSRFRSWSLGEILKLNFGQYFAVDVWLSLRSLILVKILKLGLVKILSLHLVEMLMFGWDFEVDAGRDSEDEIWSRFVFEIVILTQPSGPLCLWQCFRNIS